MMCIIDGDAIAYRAACAVQKKRWVLISEGKRIVYSPGTRKQDIEVGPGDELVREEEVEHVSHALQIAKGLMNKIKDYSITASNCPILENVMYMVYLSSQDSSDPRFKRAVSKPYKGNRPKEKPVHLAAVREYLQTYHDATVVVGEADDALAQQAMIAKDMGIPYLLVHIDKDIDQIPGEHYNFVHDIQYTITEHDADYNFWTQMLTGDSSDNVPGVKGIGPARAKKILDAALEGCSIQPDRMGHAVLTVYEEKGYSLDYFEEMFDLLRLRRYDDSEEIDQEGSGA